MVVSFGYGGIPGIALLFHKILFISNQMHIWNASISKIVQYCEDYKSAKGFTLITKITFFCKNLLHYTPFQQYCHIFEID